MSTFFKELTWDKIKWGNSYKEVRRYQRRIFKASKTGDKQLTWHLQQRLVRNPHAKLIAVHKVTTLNKGKKTAGIDGFIPTTPKKKLVLAKNLHLNGKAMPIKRTWIPKPGKNEKRPLGIPTIQDRAKQALAHLALEPEWEARFEPNSYGFRPGRSCHDAIEAIYNNLHHQVDKLVFDADIRKCFDNINHDALLAKLKSFPLMEKQIEAWLKAGIMDEYSNIPRENLRGTPQGGIISPLLANIALHGLEEHLKSYVSSRNFPKPHPKAARGARTKQIALGVIRYADDIIIIHRNPEIMNMVIHETKEWLTQLGLELSPDKSRLQWASQSFKYLGFQITMVKRFNKFRVKITPSKESVQRLIDKTRNIIQNNKSASSYALIYLLRPVLIGWGNYFCYSECKETFNKIDNIIYNQLRAWVLRRAVRVNRTKTMGKYFIRGRTYKFQNRTYQANWIFTGQLLSKNGKPVNTFLPKLSWISSKSYVKIKEDASVYNGEHLYWASRNAKYSSLSTRVKNLYNRQRGKCSACSKQFQTGDHMEVDHIIPRSQGGQDNYNNLQLLHRQCHTEKTRKDLSRTSV
jgi:RNA-directed DNA polymerase